MTFGLQGCLNPIQCSLLFESFSWCVTSPHRVLSAFTQSLMEFTITDALDLEKQESSLMVKGLELYERLS